MPRKSTTASKVNNAVQPETTEVVKEPEKIVAEKEPVKKAKVRVKPRELEPHTLIPVRNGYNGKLVFISSRTREKFVWSGFGEVLDIELQDLRSAKNTDKEFYENNWFMIDDREVLEYLGVKRYYENSLNYDNFDGIFTMSPSEVEERVKTIPKGQRSSIIYRARQLISEGKLDSIRIISALEKSLGTELIER